MDQLTNKKCVPCNAGTPPLKGEALAAYVKQLKPDWKLIQDARIEKEYLFKNFREALAFTNAVGALAEQEGHHPDILLSWGRVKVAFWTHKIGGLSENDFIMAMKCDQIKNLPV